MDSLVAELKASEMWVCVSIWLYGKFRSQCQGNSTEQLPQNALIAGQPWHTAGTERAAAGAGWHQTRRAKLRSCATSEGAPMSPPAASRSHRCEHRRG